MKTIGFNLTKIHAENIDNNKSKNSADTNLEFLEVDKTKVDVMKDQEVLVFSFKFTVTYTESQEKKEKSGEVIFEGKIILATDKEETKEILKSWKKKEIADAIRTPLFNLVLQKCSVKALTLEEDVGLPSHIPLPNIRPNPAS